MRRLLDRWLLYTIAIIPIGAIVTSAADAQSRDSLSAEVPRTLVHELIALDSEVTVVPQEKYDLLNSVIGKALQRIRYDPAAIDLRQQARDILLTIDDILIRHNFLQPTVESDLTETMSDALTPRNLAPEEIQHQLLYHSNSRRSGRIDLLKPIFYVDCDIGSFFYIAIAEQLGIDLRLVEVPRHNFVRWHFSENDYLEWETILGEEIPQGAYQTGGLVTDRQISQRIYLASMNRNELLGYYYLLRASLRKPAETRLADYEKSLAMYPQGIAVKNQLAWYYVTHESTSKSKADDALALALQAVAERPTNADYLDTLACSYAAIGAFKKAEIFERDAVDCASKLKAKEEFRTRLRGIKRKKSCLDIIAQETRDSDETKGDDLVLHLSLSELEYEPEPPCQR
jgi:hypothetical protein